MTDTTNPLIVAGSANPALARAVAAGLGVEPTSAEVDRFPDGELRPAVGDVRGGDVYVVQPTSPPVNEHLVELLLLLDACRRAGAARITAVVPYFGYARQDRRSRPGQAIGARVAADAIAAAGAARLLVVDAHPAGFESMCPIPVETLSALRVLADALDAGAAGPRVVVAPDLGAVKLAERLAPRLGLRVVVVRKSRVSGSRVAAEELIGEVEGCEAIIVDDMITTGGTIMAAARLLVARGARPRPLVAATHGLLVGPALDRLGRLGVSRLLVTDTVPVGAPGTAPPGTAPTPEVCSVAPLLAEAVGRLHREEPLDDLGPPG